MRAWSVDLLVVRHIGQVKIPMLDRRERYSLLPADRAWPLARFMHCARANR